MTRQDKFGGSWTQEKLVRLEGYLKAYMQIFKTRSFFTTVYVDAFAGTGSIPMKKSKTKEETTIQPEDQEVEEFLAGSARVALSLLHPFQHYLFIEQNAKKCQELEKLKTEYPDIASRIQIEKAEANQFLIQWCRETDWMNTRAVVFLDPFGMQVEWPLLEAIAATKAIDLWLLVPVGMGVNRMMPKHELPPEEWATRLTIFFGTNEWQSQFYRPKSQPGLFDDGTEREKNADYEGLAAYFVERLRKIFADVAPNPLTLKNSKNSPLFLLCFAVGNSKGAPTAIKIAQYLLKE